MSFWLWLLCGLAAGAAPAALARADYRSWWARRSWRLAAGLVFIALVLPVGIVLILFLIDSAHDAMVEMWKFWRDEFRGVAGFALGCLTGCGLMAWRYRGSPRLQGPPLSAEAKALARDPDKQAEAVRRYRQETGVDLAVATDVVEEFTATPAGKPERRSAGAMEWMYLGFAAAWYALFTAAYVFTFSNHGNHVLAALGFFLFFPAIFSGFCGVCGGAVSERAKAALLTGWQAGSLTRGYAFLAGLAAGPVSMAGIAGGGAVLWPYRNSDTVLLWIGLPFVAVVLLASPFLGLWLLLKKCPSAPVNAPTS